MTDSLRQDDPFTVPADWVRDMLDIVRPGAAQTADILAAAGLTATDIATPGSPIGQRQEAAVLHAITQRMQDTFFAAKLGLRMSGRTSTVVSYILHSSRTLGEAIANTTRIVPLTRPGAEVRFETRDGIGHWDLDNRDPWLRESPLYQEFLTSVVLSGLRTATGRDVRPMAVHLRATSRGRVARLEPVWDCPVSTEEDRHAIEFSEPVMQTPVRTFDAPLLTHLKHYGQLLLDAAPAAEPDLRMSVERSILGHLSRGAPPVSLVAQDLRMSVRTLTRRLAEADLTYRGLLEDVRRRKADLMLRDGTLSLAEIAFLLGYSEHSSFTNAFRRWTGMAPGTYRASLLDPTAPTARAGAGA